MLNSPVYFTLYLFLHSLYLIVLVGRFKIVTCALDFRSLTPKYRMSAYPSLLSKLYKVNVKNPVKLGLDNMHRLNSLLSYPMQNIPVVHITGTNGKGSVSTKISAALSRCWIDDSAALGGKRRVRTGLFTSPHISSFKERIQVDHLALSDDDVEVIMTCDSLESIRALPSPPYICSDQRGFSQIILHPTRRKLHIISSFHAS